MTGYARPDLIAETDWLAERLDDPAVRIVDCDDLAAYQRAHIPGAVGLRVHHYLKEEGSSASVPGIGVHVMPPEQFEQVMSRHGIGDGTSVVAYDGSGGVYAARFWWALDYHGHSACKVLNGGFGKWLAEGRPVSRDNVRPEPASFSVRPGSDCLCRIDEMKAAIDDPNVVIWDVRSIEEYRGEDRSRGNRRRGHIPGAVHMEWLDMTAPPRGSGVLLPTDEMRAKFDSLGITPDKTVLTH